MVQNMFIVVYGCNAVMHSFEFFLNSVLLCELNEGAYE
jgi:hypothetical protein